MENDYNVHPRLEFINNKSIAEADKDGVIVTHHEGAVIFAAERVIAREYTWVKDTLEKELKALADAVEDQGGLVGHIKAFLTDQSNSAMLSATDGNVQIKETRHPKVMVNIAAIVFVKNEVLLHKKFADMLIKLAS
ncbi:hypothetical protein LPY66_17800 [Dehalobacter sp. DCM]|uniref:hypothetical protein n=1 Tax=Dehalobacter sp. DCM TaxID=2907827 RepID=UPI00308165EA|nr:hypothetical protein LPY66_17800 [Dehalobacter sp. DCM]